MKWQWTVLLAFGLAAGCATTGLEPKPNPADVQLETRSFKSDEVRRVIEENKGKRTLYVFDIDNTLLQNRDGQFLGSAQWYDWQKGLPDDASE